MDDDTLSHLSVEVIDHVIVSVNNLSEGTALVQQSSYLCDYP